MTARKPPRVTFHGRLCGRCLTVTWYPEHVRAGYCQTCGETTPGQTVALAERRAEPEAADLLRAVHALATP